VLPIVDGLPGNHWFLDDLCLASALLSGFMGVAAAVVLTFHPDIAARTTSED
jgi:hypothetical protein